YKIDIDRDKLLDTLDIVAGQINAPALDPIYRLVDNQPQLAVAGHDGRKLDYDATADAMITAFAADKGEANMVVAVRHPNVTAADVANVQTPDLLGKASTSFSGSAS